MKKSVPFLICLLLQLFVFHAAICAQDTDTAKLTAKDAYNDGKLPLYHGWVTDYEDLFSDGQEAFFDSVIQKHEKETTNEIVVVTMDRPDVDTSNFETFVTMLFDNWGVGKKEMNNGVMICIFPKLRRVRIEVGSGFEKNLTDEEAKTIIDEKITPEFKKGDFFEGTKNGLFATIEQIAL